MRGQGPEETFDAFMTDLRNLALSCEFGIIKDGMLLYKIVDGLNQENLHDKILSKGGDITLIEMCRAEEVRKMTKLSSNTGSKSKEYVDIQDVHIRKISEYEEKEDAAVRSNVEAVYQGRNPRNNDDVIPHTYTKVCDYCGGRCKPRKCPAYGRRCGYCNRLTHYERCWHVKDGKEVKQNEKVGNIHSVKKYFIETVMAHKKG